MLSMSDTNIDSFIPLFSKSGVPVAFLVPTPTGFEKSIMDATAPIRQLLSEQHIHDYERQGQGKEHKRIIKTYLVNESELKETETSLYRPITKKGDPRLWIYRLQQYCKPCNLLALIVIRGELYVFNLSDTRISHSLFYGGFCAEILKEAVNQENGAAKELLSMIKDIHNRGFIPSITRGDPGVGDTLEHALGIDRNNRKTPDYKGIELKASREKHAAPNRCTLFDKTPDWTVGFNEKQILDTFGYWGVDKRGLERFQLYCTLRAGIVNSQGLTLSYNENADWVNAKSVQIASPIAGWDMRVLRQRLLEKHPATFWVKASVDHDENGWEYFRYDHIMYTRNPNVSLFSSLIDEGIVSVDFLMHYEPSGMIRDHGFPFKLLPNNVGLLFPEIIEFDLSAN